MVELPHNLREVTDAVVLSGVDGQERYHEKKYGGQASEPVGLVLFHGCFVLKGFVRWAPTFMMTFTYNGKAIKNMGKRKRFCDLFLFLFLGFAYLSMFLSAACHGLSTLGSLPPHK